MQHSKKDIGSDTFSTTPNTYTWTGNKTNLHFAKELEITPVLDKLLEYKRNWIQHVN
jgi:hypothetical protein